jgi:hypothetical protein
MSDRRPLGQAAWQHVKALAADIGPRPAGSAAERQALDYAAARLQAWGYPVERLAARFAPLPRFFALYSLGGLALALGGWWLTRLPWLVIFLPVCIVALPQLARWLTPLRARTAQSENLLAYTPGLAGVPTLILCAHVDSARASVFRGRLWRQLQSRTMYVALRVAVAVGALALLAGLGLTIPPALVWAVAGAGTVVGVWWMLTELLNQLAWRGDYSPGAHDDASGVGVVLALAEYFARNPTGRVRLGFLFTGAEETGMHGAAAFAAGSKPDDRTSVLNFDMVGAGDRLCVVEGDGTLWPLRTDARLNARLHAAQPGLRRLWYTLRSGDFLPFLRYGWRATSLQTSGSARAELGYHTAYDTLEVIEPAALEMAAQAVVRLVQAWAD